MTSIDDLYDSPLAGALWETGIFCELRRHLACHPSWQLYYWRDLSKEADFLLHKAGRFKIADAKWSEHPSNAGKLEKVRAELPANTSAGLFCRASNAYPITAGVEAIPITDLPDFLR